ncbi:Alpha/Beta hydrolase protein [Phaeosphaeriaceae sp. PMI808]|nr:Alpha/Beta hydrolase protein [Phaeosphaeriaceae sp. PMI808]
MVIGSNNEHFALTQMFHYENATHSYDIKWCSVGDLRNPPVVFIHGTPWSSYVWKPFALALSRHFHVYLFDNPGFGESPLERELDERTFQPRNEVEKLDADLARQTEVFAALYSSWQTSWSNQKAHIIAHDHGGLMSLRAYLLHNCCYASLCLTNVVALGPFEHTLFKTVAESPRHFEKPPDMAFEGILESYIRNAAFKELSKETMYRLKAPWMRRGGKAGFIRQLCQAGSRSTETVENRYGEIGQNIPVSIIWGSEDNWIPVEVAQRLGSALHAKKVIQIEEAGHLIMYDQPAQLGVELGIWLSTMTI